MRVRVTGWRIVAEPQVDEPQGRERLGVDVPAGLLAYLPDRGLRPRLAGLPAGAGQGVQAVGRLADDDAAPRLDDTPDRRDELVRQIDLAEIGQSSTASVPFAQLSSW